MSDVNTNFEASQIAQTHTPNFDAVILPIQQGGKSAPSDVKDSPQSAAKDSASAGQEQKSLDVPQIAAKGWPDADQTNKPELNPKRQSVVDATERALGTQPWKSDERANITQNGLLAGGVNLSAIVRDAGYSDVDAAYIRGTNGVEDQLIKNHGWKRNDVSAAKPGDIYIMPSGTTGTSTVGIVGKDGSLYSHSKDGTVMKFHRALRSDGYVLSPPES
jgi:hypothetical protein